MYNPSFAYAMPPCGSSKGGSFVFSEGNSVNFLTKLAKANLASSKANLIPRHPRGPCPKGRKAYLKQNGNNRQKFGNCVTIISNVKFKKNTLPFTKRSDSIVRGWQNYFHKVLMNEIIFFLCTQGKKTLHPRLKMSALDFQSSRAIFPHYFNKNLNFEEHFS